MPVADFEDIEAPSDDERVEIPQYAPGQPNRVQLAFQNNNPGNLRNKDGSWQKFERPEDGYRAIKTRAARHAEESLSDYLTRYAPPSENDTESYIKNAEKALGVPRSTKVSQIDADKLAQFHAKQESGSSIHRKANLDDIEAISEPAKKASLDDIEGEAPEEPLFNSPSTSTLFDPKTGKEVTTPDYSGIPGLAPGLDLPGVPKPPLPAPNRVGTPNLEGNAPNSAESAPESTLHKVFMYPERGVEQAIAGAERMAEPLSTLAPAQVGPSVINPKQPPVSPAEQARLSKQFASGAADVLGGATQAATPFMMGGMIAAPVEAALSIGIGALTQKGADELLKKLDVPEEYAALASTIAGLAGAGASGYLTGLPGMVRNAAFRARLRSILQDKVNAEYAARVKTEKMAQEAATPKLTDKGEVGPVAEPPKTAKVSDIVEGEFEDLPETKAAEPETKAPANEAVPVEPETAVVKAGQSFENPDGKKFTVTELTADGKVRFESEEPTGVVTRGTLSAGLFKKMVSGSKPVQPGQPKPEGEAAPAPRGEEVVQPEPSEQVATAAGAPEETHVPVNSGDQGLQQPGEVRPGEGSAAGVQPVPPGNGPGGAGGLPEPGAGAPGVGQPELPAGDQGANPGAVRRVTGSAPIPLSPEGIAQDQALAAKAVKMPFDFVISSPETRALQTAGFFGKPTQWQQFNARRAGALEGQVSSEVKPQLADLVKNPDTAAPGNSPLSGEPGESYRDFITPNLQATRVLEKSLKPGERALVVTHGGNLQAINAWAEAGKPADYKFDLAPLADKPYWSETGQLFRMGPRSLERVADNHEPGLYFLEHGATAYNPPKSTEKSGNKGEGLISKVEKPATAESIGKKILQFPDRQKHTILRDIPGTEELIKEIAGHLQINEHIVSLLTPDEAEEELALTYPEVLAGKEPTPIRGEKGAPAQPAEATPTEQPKAKVEPRHELSPTTEVLDRFHNPETGMQGEVAKISRGYSAILRDVDSGNSTGQAFIYPTRERAIAKAKQLAGIKEENGESVQLGQGESAAQTQASPPKDVEVFGGAAHGAPIVEQPVAKVGDRVAVDRPDGSKANGTVTGKTKEGMFKVAIDNGVEREVHPTRIHPLEKPVEAGPSEAAPIEKGQMALADSVLRKLTTGGDLGNNVQFQQMADEAFGGSRAQGKYEMKQAYDAIEAAVNRYIADSIGSNLLLGDPAYSVDQLRKLMEKLPTQNIRSEQQELLQQFSTPPTLSFLAAKIAGIRSADVVLEPSAGTGSLLAWAKAAGAIVRGNEIDPQRRTLLGYAVRGSEPTSADAEFLNATLPAEIKPTVVIMNPPFSATGGRVKSNKNLFGYRHVTEALKRLLPGGRLVAILGEGARLDAPNARQFWQQVRGLGTIRANVGISGKEYAKYGTTFGNRLVVIDKVPTSANIGTPLTGDFDRVEKAYGALEYIAGDRKQLSEGSASAPLVEPSGKLREPTGGERTVSQPGSGEPGTPSARPATGGVPEGRPAGTPESVRGEEPGRGSEEQPASATSSSDVGDSGESAVEPLRPEDRVQLEARKHEDLLERTEDDGAFVEYVPSLEGFAHPGRLVETKVMASVDPPAITYRPNLPNNVKAPKPLSAAQMETVARAGMNHQQFSDTGERQGFLLGDGTGVGKGQQLAAIIWDRYRSGQKRAVWLSATKGLQNDARRDFLGIGAKELADKLHSVNDYTAAGDIDLKDGVIFSTYSSLIAKAKGEKGQTRLDQLKKWLGEDGVIIFDEAHKAKNAVAGGARAVESKTGVAVVKLQDDLPKAYVTYASATSATDVNNLGYLNRLGLWGKGTAFPNGFTHFMSEVGRGGVAAMEMISRESKAMGKYLSRSISYKGIKYEESIHKLTEDQRKTYDTAAKAWQNVLNAATQQIRDNNSDGSSAKGEFAQAFWGEHQRFFRKLLTAMKMPTILDRTDAALAEGKSVVISLIGTGQAQADQALAAGAEDDDLDFSPKDSLIRMIRQSYPTVLYEEYEDEQGNQRKRPLVRDGKVLENPEAVAKRDELIKEIEEELKLPDNPLDFIIRNYGRDKVAELTGRRKTVERNPRTGKWESVSRAPEGIAMDKVNEHEMDQFQSGKKKVAVISKAAGTGISLHADLSAKNQTPRKHIVMELSWSADDQMQSFGRTHRSNEKQPPDYDLVSTDAGGERRFSSTIARRLESLGALTTGQRDASGGGSVLAKYNFETEQGEQAAQAFYTHLLNDDPQIGGLTGHEVLQKMGILKQRLDSSGQPVGIPYMDRADLTNVTRLLNRILNVEIGSQNAVYEYFTSIFDSIVQRAIQAGTLDTGVALVAGDRIRLLSNNPIAEDPTTGAKTYHYVVEAERKTKPVPSDAISRTVGDMYKRREFKGAEEPNQLAWVRRSSVPITARSGAVEDAYGMVYPYASQEQNIERIPESELNQNWEPIEGADNLERLDQIRKDIKRSEKLVEDYKDMSYGQHYKDELKRLEGERKELNQAIKEAKAGQFKLWDRAVAASPKSVKEQIHMIGGSVMRVWSYLNVGHGRMDIRIAYPESGGSIAGVVMNEGDANRVERALTGNKIERTTSSIFEAALGGKESFDLAGGVRLMQGRINREPVINVISSDYNVQKFLDSIGVQKEKIGWSWRYYIPGDRKTDIPVLENLIKQYPVMDPDGPGPNGERGSIPMLSDLAQVLKDRFGDDGENKANYSGMGALESRFNPGGNLSQLERASKTAHAAAIRAASDRAQSMVILRQAIPQLKKALEGSDVSMDEMRLAMIESRLRGLRERWTRLADEARGLSDEDLEKGTDAHLIDLLKGIAGKKDLPQDLAQTAMALREQKDWDNLRDFLGESFDEASDSVTTAMPQEWFDAVTSDPQFKDALQVYKTLVEKPLAENHALNEGIFSDALGPLDTYYPLIPLDRKQVQGPGRRLPYHKPKNIANAFATGMAEGYDPGVEALRDRIAAAVRSNDKAALISALESSSLLSKLGKNQETPESFTYRGEDYEPEKIELSPSRLLIEKGKGITPIPAQFGIMPKWAYNELKPILERQGPGNPTALDKFIQVLNTITLTGVAEPVFHASNLLGTLIANTPFLEDSLGGKAMSAPFVKKFGAIYQIAKTDPTTEEAAKDLIEMSKLGLVPERYASITFSKKAAEEMGAEQRRFSLAPILFGPKGIDIRARLVMYRLAKAINPGAKPQELYHFVNQLGNYVPALQSEMERAMKRTGYSPFITAGTTMLKNGLNAWTGAGPMPKSGIGLRVWQQLTGGAVAMLALWAFMYHQSTGQWPWQDTRAKLMAIPVSDKVRNSKLGQIYWGDGPGVGYVNLGFFNPLIMRGGRAMGAPSAFQAANLHGTFGQQLEAAQTDMMNAWSEPFMGPPAKAAFVGITGQEPYVTGIRDRSGSVGLQLFPAIPPKTAPGLPSLGQRGFAAARQINSFYGNGLEGVGRATGMLGEDQGKKGNMWAHMLVDYAFPGLFGNASNPFSKEEMLQQQQKGVESTGRRVRTGGRTRR